MLLVTSDFLWVLISDELLLMHFRLALPFLFITRAMQNFLKYSSHL